MTEIISIGISFPKGVLTEIDAELGDVPQSRYLLRVVENALQSEKNEGSTTNCDNKKATDSQDSLDSRFESLQSSESRSK